MEKDKEILERLHAIKDKEWLEILDKLTVFVRFKLKGKTIFGAHSEQNLGVEPVEYYVDEAIGKLFGLEWEWQFEKYSLIDQLKRIVGSMISTNVENFRKKKEKVIPTENESLSVLVEKVNVNNENDDVNYQLFTEALEKCSQDDEELQLYVMALDECNSFDDMSIELGWGKKTLYSLQQKMARRVIKYLETKKELVK